MQVLALFSFGTLGFVSLRMDCNAASNQEPTTSESPLQDVEDKRIECIGQWSDTADLAALAFVLPCLAETAMG